MSSSVVFGCSGGGYNSDVFNRIDVANKGFVTRQELTTYIKKYNLSEADTKTIVESLIPLECSFISKDDFMHIFNNTVKSNHSSTCNEPTNEKSQNEPVAVGCNSMANGKDISVRNESFYHSKSSSTAKYTNSPDKIDCSADQTPQNSSRESHMSRDRTHRPSNQGDIHGSPSAVAATPTGRELSNKNEEAVVSGGGGDTDQEWMEYFESLALSDDLSEEQESIVKIWKALKSNQDVCLEEIFKNFLGKVFVELCSQQDVIEEQKEKIREISSVEQGRFLELELEAENELKTVIEQYEQQVKSSIQKYETKIEMIRREQMVLCEELEHKNRSEIKKSIEIQLLNRQTESYRLELEQLKNELERLRVRNETEKMLDVDNCANKLHAIDQFTTPRRTSKAEVFVFDTFSGISNSNCNYKDSEVSCVQSKSGSSFYETPPTVATPPTSKWANTENSTILFQNSCHLPRLESLVNEDDADDTFYSVNKTNKSVFETTGDLESDKSHSSQSIKESEEINTIGSCDDERFAFGVESSSESSDHQVSAPPSVVSSTKKRRKVIRSEGTSADLEDSTLTITVSSSEDENSAQSSTSADPFNIDNVVSRDYVELDWHQFPNLVEYTFKVIVCGDAAVGKTSFLNQLCVGEFRESTIATIGMSFFRKKFRVSRRGQTFGVELQCWDTAGQEKFRSLPQSYFRNADAVILMFDLSRKSTFVNIGQWIVRIEQVADFPRLILIGNKNDCKVEDREVTVDESEALARNIDAFYFEASAKTGQGVVNTFQQLAEVLVTDQIYKNQGRVLSMVENNSNDRLNIRYENGVIDFTNSAGGPNKKCFTVCS